MKKLFLSIAIIAVLFSASSCGTILGGKISECQKTKPASGSRAVRPAALIFDIIGPLPIIAAIVDFADGGMYKPCADKK
jgi:hypothetical protein